VAEGQFKPEEHRFGPTHWFEDLKLGQTFYINSRTQTEALFAAFQLASGDNHPIHYDREYCRVRGHRDLLAHGLQVAIQGAAGAGIFPHVIGDSLIGFLEQTSRLSETGLLRRHALSHAGSKRARTWPHDRRRDDEAHHP
jgi:hypothetical protein